MTFLMSTTVTGTGQKCTDLVCGESIVQNYVSMLIIATSLYNAYNNCLDILKTSETCFWELEKSIHPELLAEWSKMDDVPRKNGKDVISVHVARCKDGILSLYKFYPLFTPHISCSRTTDTGKGLYGLDGIRSAGCKHFWYNRCRAFYQYWAASRMRSVSWINLLQLH